MLFALTDLLVMATEVTLLKFNRRQPSNFIVTHAMLRGTYLVPFFLTVPFSSLSNGLSHLKHSPAVLTLVHYLQSAETSSVSVKTVTVAGPASSRNHSHLPFPFQSTLPASLDICKFHRGRYSIKRFAYGTSHIKIIDVSENVRFSEDACHCNTVLPQSQQSYSSFQHPA